MSNAGKRIVRLADLEAVKWVTGCFRDRSIETRRLTAEEIAEIADIEMHQPYPAEPGTWANVSFPEKYITVMAIVASDATERGAILVASGQTYTLDQADGIAIGSYAEQQTRLASQTGECSEGCCRANTALAPRIQTPMGVEARQVCRHTLRPCLSCDRIPTEKRIELLERLLIVARRLTKSHDWSPELQRDCDTAVGLVCEIDGDLPPVRDQQAGPTTEPTD